MKQFLREMWQDAERWFYSDGTPLQYVCFVIACLIFTIALAHDDATLYIGSH